MILSKVHRARCTTCSAAMVARTKTWLCPGCGWTVPRRVTCPGCGALVVVTPDRDYFHDGHIFYVSPDGDLTVTE